MSASDEARRLIEGIVVDDSADLAAGILASEKVAAMAATTYRRLLREGIDEATAKAVLMSICLEPYRQK